ncbi:MAG: ArsR family transcriptional regulator [Deltaproteobacteria bacterium]|jgi:DNA-binding transcriptional ArsR family regulator|nr:ArsR family transcriptional regulator [Deltaproteobacteria bacterium]
MQTPVELLEDSRKISALAHPVRASILEALRTPDTAAGIARTFGRSRQYVSYHLKELERVGLVQHTGERRKGNFVEQLYEATARRFVVSSRFASNPERLASVFRDQVSLSQLSDLGERLQRDAAGLVDLAARQDEEIPSATVEAELRFADDDARAAFLAEYVDILKSLLAKYGGAEGEPYRVALATYPELEDAP